MLSPSQDYRVLGTEIMSLLDLPPFLFPPSFSSSFLPLPAFNHGTWQRLKSHTMSIQEVFVELNLVEFG